MQYRSDCPIPTQLQRDPLELYERLALVLTLVVTTLGAVFESPASVSLASEPVSRYQLVVKEVLVHNDHEGALAVKGDMKLSISVILCPNFLPSPCFYDGEQVGAMVAGPTRSRRVLVRPSRCIE